MPITPDQNATLQLLLERGQSYADLASLLGEEEADVRSRARAALSELGGADPDRNVGLTDYLLGQADPIGRADAVRHLRDDPDDHRLAGELAETLREMYPNAELPRLPGEPRQPRRPRAASGEADGRSIPALSLSQRQTRLVVGLGAAAVILIAAVLGITGAFSGDDGGDPVAAAESEGDSPEDERAVPVELKPVKGSDAGGVAVFGFASADQPYIELQLRKLQPPNKDDAYVLWFLTGQDEGFPLPSPLEVDNKGNLSDRISVPAEVIGIATQSQTIAVALNNRNQLNREIDRALDEEEGTLSFPGGTVLSARIAGGQADAQG